MSESIYFSPIYPQIKYFSYLFHEPLFERGVLMKKIVNWVMVILFGKNSLDGYYKQDESTKNKNYILASVFPNEESVKTFLEHQSK